MAAVPPIPARRKVPPPPPARNGSASPTVPAAAGRKVPPPPSSRNASATEPTATVSNDGGISEPALGGIAARIAALKLNQVSGGKPLGNDTSPASPRPRAQGSSVAEPLASSNNLTKAIKRAPPPVPGKQLPEHGLEASVSEGLEETPAPVLPTLPPRKVPPLPARRTPNQTVPREPSPEPEPGPAPVPTTSARRLPPPPAPRSPSPEVAPAAPPPINRSTRPAIPFHTRPSFAASDVVETPQYEYESEYGADSGYGSAEPEEVPAEVCEEETCLKCRSFEVVDEHAAQFPREEVASLEQLAYDLTAPFESATDKARAIFVWLHHNIAYDAYSFLNNCVQPQTPEGVLQSGLAVCDGYAGLFRQLAEVAGLHVLRVGGHGKGYGYAPIDGEAPPYKGNHAWNAVVMDDNEWHHIDACWGAGVLGADSLYHQRFAPANFTSTNIEFGRKHFPEDPAYQMREDGTVVSWEEYVLAPPGPLVTSTFETHQYHLDTLWPDAKCIAGGYEHTFHVQKTCWHIEKRDYWNDYPLMLLIDVDGQQTREALDRVENYEGWTKQLYIPLGEGSVQLAIVATWDNWDARGLDPYEAVAGVGRKAMSWEILVRWDVV